MPIREYILLDYVHIISRDVFGYIVDISKGGKMTIEKEGNEGPIYWDVEPNDVEFVDEVLK